MTISLDAVSVAIGGATLLDQISTSFARGRVTALIGPNGAGKTTLLRTILGLHKPRAGRTLIDGQPINSLPRKVRAQRLSWLAQASTPHWNVSTRELISLGRLPWGGTAHDPQVVAAMKATETLEFADRLIDSLSGGERARVMFARVLASESDWILADEPLANLDPPHQRDSLRLLAGAAHERGKGVIVVLHELSAAAAIADDILVLKGGRVIADTLDEDSLEAAFGIGFDIISHGTGVSILAKD